MQKRGFASGEEEALLAGKTQEELLELLHADKAVLRTAAANLLVTAGNSKVTGELLEQLSVEQCLYTRIGICESLEKGDSDTARQMMDYIGKIGSNQYKQLPEKVSKKKSYPLPRDIIARALGKMQMEVFPVLMEALKCGGTEKVSEVLDAIGFMVFYNRPLANDENVRPVFEIMEKYKENNLVLWKGILCLSAFPLPKTKKILEGLVSRDNLLGEEAKRSLRLIGEDCK